MLHQIIKPFVFSFSLILLSWLVSRFIINKNSHRKKYPLSKEILIVAFLVYLAWVLCLTLLPIPVTSKSPVYKQVNMVPVVYSVQQYKAAFHGTIGYLKELYLQNLFGNILLFIPFGFLLPMILKYKTFKRIFYFALLFSITIELSQFAAHYFGSFRSVDIDDILLNVIGAIIGFFFYKSFQQLSAKQEMSTG